MVKGDRQKIQRAAANLLDKAIKYTPRGSVITVTAKINTGKSSVEISGTGIGISANGMPHIFERFHRCDRDRSNSGSGLGPWPSFVLMAAGSQHKSSSMAPPSLSSCPPYLPLRFNREVNPTVNLGKCPGNFNAY
ncbi:MAG: sensor histidine kinase [Desulfosarcinaceae bacterium]